MAAQSAGALTEPFHGAIPYTQWQWFGRYLRNVGGGSPNLVVSAQSKMFVMQDHDGNGSASGFVCSASTIGQDAVWTAGHCLSNGLNGAGADGGSDQHPVLPFVGQRRGQPERRVLGRD